MEKGESSGFAEVLLEEVVCGLEQGGYSWEEVDLPHDAEGCTPLISACQRGLPMVMQFLLERGADMTLCNHSNQTALHVSQPDLQVALLLAMFRPLPHRAQLLQAAWQGDFYSLQHLLAQTDLVDVNAQNQNGLTPLMLAVRDVDLFEGLQTHMPWKYSPVEVVRELLALSADLEVRDRGGSSVLQYVSQIKSSLKDELIQMMMDSLTQPVPTPLELEGLYPEELSANSSISSPTHSFLSQTSAIKENVEVSLECVSFSERQKVDDQDKGISYCFQGAMDTLRDMRQVYKDLRKGSSQTSSLPSLWDRNRGLDKLGTLYSTPELHSTTGPSYLPVPPRVKEKCKPVLQSLPVPHSSQLSQSAPSLMEPLLDASALLQVRAHIHNRLGGAEAERQVNEQKCSLPDLCPKPIRTPKLLAPLDRGHRCGLVLSGLKHPLPLKPISLMPLSSVSRTRRERPSRGRSRGSRANRGGSEESASSSTSSQGSLDLEEEEGKGLPETLHKSPGRTSEETPLVDLVSLSQSHNQGSSGIGAAGNRGRLAEGRKDGVPIISKSERKGHGEAEAGAVEFEISPLLATESSKDVRDIDGTSGFTSNCKDEVDTGLKVVMPADLLKEVQCVAQSESCAHRDVNITVSEMELFPEEKRKPIKTVKNRDRRGSTYFQTNHSFNILAHKHQSRGIVNTKINQRNTSIPSHVKTKERKTPDIVISGEATVKSGWPRTAATKTGQKNTDPPSTRKRISEPLWPKRSSSDKKCLNNVKAQSQKQLQLSARPLKKPGISGTPRAKSAVDYVTYSDMFREINREDEGPAIFEMFATPLYDNLRVSSSVERTRQVQSAPPLKSQTHIIKIKCPKILESSRKKKIQMDKFSPAKGKQRRNKDILPKGHQQPHPVEGEKDNVVFISSLDWHIKTTMSELIFSDSDGEMDTPITAVEQKVDHALSVIEEVLSSQSETSFPHCKLEEKTCATEKEDTSQQIIGTGHCAQEIVLLESKAKTVSKTGHNNVESTGVSKESSLLCHPTHPKINTWTSGSRDRTASPVYHTFLDEVGEGPLTDDLLRCLAEELISLEERETETPYPENTDQREFRDDPPLKMEKPFHKGITSVSEVPRTEGSWVDDAITWTKGEVLGRGAYGTVYCGLTSQGQLIAVKQVALDASDPKTAEKEYGHLQGEVDLLKNLSHNNIVEFLGTALSENVVSIFMEYVPGGSISSILHRFGPLPEKVLALYTRQILEGVAYLHDNRVIHRDLKGNNVMLMPTGVVKLIDFGCARRLSCLTHTGSRSDLLKSVHGTPYWMAPEVINETGHGRKSDIWSIGCTVFEMATGKPPLAHMDKMAALFYIGARKGLMPSLPDDFSEDAKNFVQACLTSDQKRRPSAEQLLGHPFLP